MKPRRPTITQSVSVYGFGSAFCKKESSRDVDLLILHDDISQDSCKYAIKCKSLLAYRISNAHITMLSRTEVLQFNFINVAKASYVGSIRNFDLNEVLDNLESMTNCNFL